MQNSTNEKTKFITLFLPPLFFLISYIWILISNIYINSIAIAYLISAVVYTLQASLTLKKFNLGIITGIIISIISVCLDLLKFVPLPVLFLRIHLLLLISYLCIFIINIKSNISKLTKDFGIIKQSVFFAILVISLCIAIIYDKSILAPLKPEYIAELESSTNITLKNFDIYFDEEVEFDVIEQALLKSMKNNKVPNKKNKILINTIIENGELVNGKKHGKWSIKYPNGAIKQFGTWENGIAFGFFRNYYPNGKKESEGTIYREKNGEWTYWYNNGQIKCKGTYSKGSPYGKWLYWKINGIPDYEELWSNDGSWSRLIKYENDTIND